MAQTKILLDTRILATAMELGIRTFRIITGRAGGDGSAGTMEQEGHAGLATHGLDGCGHSGVFLRAREDDPVKAVQLTTEIDCRNGGRDEDRTVLQRDITQGLEFFRKPVGAVDQETDADIQETLADPCEGERPGDVLGIAGGNHPLEARGCADGFPSEFCGLFHTRRGIEEIRDLGNDG